MTPALPPSTLASVPPDTPAPQRPSSLAPLPPDTPAPQRPGTLAPLLRWWEAWKSFGRAMGDFQSRILLGLFYFLVITPFGIGTRAFGNRLLLRTTGRSSNWIPRKDATDVSVDDARKQF